MANILIFEKFYLWYAKLVVKYHKIIVAIFTIFSFIIPIATYFLCPFPVIEDIREEFVIRGSEASGKLLQYHNLRSLSTHPMDNISTYSNETEFVDNNYGPISISSSNSNITKSKSCSDFNFQFVNSKRIIVSVPDHKIVQRKQSEFSNFEEIKLLCKMENQIKSLCDNGDQNCVVVISKASLYMRILNLSTCDEISYTNVRGVNNLINTFTTKLMKRNTEHFNFHNECWMIKFLFYFVPLKSTETIAMTSFGVSMLYFQFSDNDRYGIDLVTNIIATNNVEILGSRIQDENEIVQTILLIDLTKESFLIIPIVVLLWWFSKSIIISLYAVLLIFDAIFLGYLIYIRILTITTFPFLNFMNFILLLALGADDVLIYILFSNKSFKETTCPVSKMSTIIGLSFATISSTSLSTIISLLFCFTSSIVAIKCFSIYGAIIIASHFLLVICFLPSIIFLFRSFYFEKILFSYLNSVVYKIPGTCRLFSRFLVKYFQLAFHCYTVLLIIALFILMYYPKLQYPNKFHQDIVRNNHPSMQYNIHKKDFIFERNSVEKISGRWTVNVVWGVYKNDVRSWTDLEYYSKITLDYEFDILNRTSLKWLENICTIISTNQNTPIEMKEYIAKRTSFGLSVCPLDAGLSAFKRFSVDNDCFSDILRCFNQFTKLEDTESLTSNFRFYFQDDKVVGLIVSFDLNITEDASYIDIRQSIINIEHWFQDHLYLAPKGLRSGFVIFDSVDLWIYLLYSAISDYLLLSFILSLLSCGLVAFVSTRNVKITLLTVFVLSSILIQTVATLTLFNWRIGIVEAAIFTLATGIGIDFCLHFAVAYSNHESARKGTIFDVISEIIWPVTLTSLTTGLSGVPLINSHLVIFYQLGTFLIVCSIWSVVTVVIWFPCCVLLIDKLTLLRLNCSRKNDSISVITNI